jgi:predicted AAA+ superfamily ATPase
MMGGSTLFLTEVHKYKNRSMEIKNIYDEFPNLKVVFTGSSMLEIFRPDADLSRRARHYMLYRMSFRKYLIYEGLPEQEQKSYSLDEILNILASIAMDICRKINPVPALKKYFQYGYYPYYKEDRDGYYDRVLQPFNAIVDIDLFNVENLRKTFFVNQLQVKHKLICTQNANFQIDNKIFLAIRGRDMGQR